MVASFYFLYLAVKMLPIRCGVCSLDGYRPRRDRYIGILLFGETRDGMKVTCVLLMVSGIAGLKITSQH